MDHFHKQRSSFNSKWRDFPVRQSSVPQVLQGTSPNINISIVSSLQPKKSQVKAPQIKQSIFGDCLCPSHKKMYYMSYQVHEWPLSFLRTKYDLCQGHIPGSALREGFLPVFTSRNRLHPWNQHSLLFFVTTLFVVTSFPLSNFW